MQTSSKTLVGVAVVLLAALTSLVAQADDSAQAVASPAHSDQRAHDETEPSFDPAQVGGEFKIFNQEDLVKLSRVLRETRNVPLEERCEVYERTLREILPQSADRGTLFKEVIDSLAARTVLPSFRAQNSEQPYVKQLRECVDQLADYRPASSPKRTVVAGPSPDSRPSTPKGDDPMVGVMNEFAQVKERVVDPVKDLYPPRAAQAAELKHHEDHESDSDSDHDSHSDSSSDAGSRDEELDDQLDQLHTEWHHEADEHHSRHHDEHHPPHTTMEPALVHELVQEELEEEELEHRIERERDPVRKLELQLEREQKRTKSLVEQLDKNRYELEDLLEEKERRERSSQLGASDNENVLDRSRYEMMKSLYEEVREREERTNAKLDELSRQLAACQSREFEAKGPRYESDDESDEDDDDDEKAYKDLGKMVGKLQDKMSSSESPARRCQKYYLLLNFPGKVTKKVVKTVAKLALPESEPTGEFYESLRSFAGQLAQTKSAKKAVRELDECLGRQNQAGPRHLGGSAVAFGVPIEGPSSFHQHHQYGHGPHDYYHQFVSTSKDNEVPVTVFKTKSRSSSFSHDHHSVRPLHDLLPHRPLLPGVPTPPHVPSAFAHVRANTNLNRYADHLHPPYY